MSGGKIQLKFVIQSVMDIKQLHALVSRIRKERLQSVTWILQPESSKANEVYGSLLRWAEKYLPQLASNIRYLPQIHKVMNIK